MMLFSKGIRRVISRASGRGIQYRCRSSPRPTVLRIRGLPYSLIQILPPIPSHQTKHVRPESLDFRWSESRDPAEHLDRVWLFPIDRRHHPSSETPGTFSSRSRGPSAFDGCRACARSLRHSDSSIGHYESAQYGRPRLLSSAIGQPSPAPDEGLDIRRHQRGPVVFPPKRRRYGHVQSRSRPVRSCGSVSVRTGMRPTLAARSPLEPIPRNPEPCIFPIVTAPS